MLPITRAERKSAENEALLTTLLDPLPPAEKWVILRGKETGNRLTTMPSLVNATVLSPQEFRDGLSLRLYRIPAGLPARCDGGCDQKYDVRHGLSCKHGGLVIIRHNEIRDELGHLASLALTPSAVRDKPLIHHSHNADLKSASVPTASKAPAGTTPPPPVTCNNHSGDEDRGDLLLRGF